MTPIKRLRGKLTSIADNIRDKSGGTEKLTIDQMNQEIAWLESEFDETETYILVDADGNEIAAVATEEIVEITATPNDVREGKTVVTGDGIEVGTKHIPSYHTEQGHRVIMSGAPVRHVGNNYDYTELQAMVCDFNTTVLDSVAVNKVAVNNSVYDVRSTVALSSVTVDHEGGAIDFGITNDSGKMQILRYFYYKEVE